MSTVLAITALTKTYKERIAVDHVSFSLQKGKVLCLLGPNGAGKTTTIHMIAGVIPVDHGTICFQGAPMSGNQQSLRRKIGFVPQNVALYEHLTALQNVRFFASLYGIKGSLLNERTKQALLMAGLWDRKSDKVATFSGGMKRRLNIACSLAHHPDLVIMDEPTVGIDPQSRNHIMNTIRSLQSQGVSILYTTHYMEEVEMIGDDIVIMDHGKVIKAGTLSEIKHTTQDLSQIIVQVDDLQKIHKDHFFQIPGIQEVECRQGKLHLITLSTIDNLDQIIACIMKDQMKIRHLECQQMDLESVFLKLTGRRLRD